MSTRLPLLPLFPASHKLAAELAPRRERQPGTCKRCKLSFNSGNPCLPVDGKVGGLLIVSDYPGEQEDKHGMPFVGASGQFLRNNIKAMWGSEPVAYTNALNCRVPQGTTLKNLVEPVKKCRDYLRDTLEEVKPTRVIAMGAVAIYSLTGRMLPPMSVRRGYTWLSDGTPVFYMTNPAHAVRNYFLKQRFETDLKWALFTNPRRRNGVYLVIRSLEEVAYAEQRLMDAPRWHTFDCETKGRMFDQGFGVTTVSICKGGDDYTFVWDEVALANPKLTAPMKRVLESEVGKGGFNVKYDINAVYADPDLRIEVPNVVADLMLWRHQSDSNIKDNSLNVCTEILGLGGAKEEGHEAVSKMVTAMRKSAKKSEVMKDQLQFCETRDALQDAFEATYPDVRAQAYAYAKIPQDTRNRYNARDTFTTDQGILAFQDVMEKSAHMGWMWEEVYRPAVRGMAFIERSGMAVDRNAVIALALALDQSLGELKYQLSSFGKFDPDSPASTGRFLFGPRSMGGLELPDPMSRKGKAGSTEAAVLAQLHDRHPIIPVLEEYRKLSTLQKRYARGMLPYICADGRVHSSLLLEGADTGRISSRDPNMQNVPTKENDKWAVMVRNCFIARPGYTLCVWDYSQLELRVAALLSQDPKFIEVVNSGADIHRATAAMVYNKPIAEVADDERTYVKRIVFGTLLRNASVQAVHGPQAPECSARSSPDRQDLRHVRSARSVVGREHRVRAQARLRVGDLERQTCVPSLRVRDHVRRQGSSGTCGETNKKHTSARIRSALHESWCRRCWSVDRQEQVSCASCQHGSRRALPRSP
jgi:uracil-DNA glycosylase family 4